MVFRSINEVLADNRAELSIGQFLCNVGRFFEKICVKDLGFQKTLDT